MLFLAKSPGGVAHCQGQGKVHNPVFFSFPCLLCSWATLDFYFKTFPTSCVCVCVLFTDLGHLTKTRAPSTPRVRSFGVNSFFVELQSKKNSVGLFVGRQLHLEAKE